MIKSYNGHICTFIQFTVGCQPNYAYFSHWFPIAAFKTTKVVILSKIYFSQKRKLKSLFRKYYLLNKKYGFSKESLEKTCKSIEKNMKLMIFDTHDASKDVETNLTVMPYIYHVSFEYNEDLSGDKNRFPNNEIFPDLLFCTEERLNELRYLGAKITTRGQIIVTK